jgi:hypothetical protein
MRGSVQDKRIGDSSGGHPQVRPICTGLRVSLRSKGRFSAQFTKGLPECHARVDVGMAAVHGSTFPADSLMVGTPGEAIYTTAAAS